MTFYVKPPRGEINLYKLEECIKQRLICYDNLRKSDKIVNFDCLIDDSALDRTGHYIFRLQAYVQQAFVNDFLKYECKLLQLRLICYSRGDFKNFLIRLLKHSKEGVKEESVHETIREMYVVLLDVCCYMLRKNYLNHVFNNSHNETICESFILRVPFQFCASLIYNRDVNICQGFVEISCNEWKKVILSLYETYLRKVLNAMKYSHNVQTAINDMRVKQMFQLINDHWFKNTVYNNIIKSKFDIRNINEEFKLFPLCMLNLYKVLQKTNRLSHNDRYDFSLYMKGIGMSLTDSLKFWENAYSKEHSSCSNCTHSWQDNKKRYIYGIRHLYGLEGSKRNYQVGSCVNLQGKTIGSLEHGGCPFQHFDDSNLTKALNKLFISNDEDVDIIVRKRKENPTAACKMVYKNIFRIITSKQDNDELNFQNPAEYYELLKRRVNESNRYFAMDVSLSLSNG